MAETVKSGGKCWSEGVEVPCPESMKPKKTTSKPIGKKKTASKKKDRIMDAWEEAEKRQKKWQR